MNFSFLFFFFLFTCNIAQSAKNITIKGISFVGDRYCPEVPFTDPLALESLSNLKKTGANYISLIVTEYQDYLNSTEIYPIYKDFPKNGYYTFKTESIQGIKKIVTEAHKLELSVMLKPHIDIIELQHNAMKWRGEIGKFSSKDNWEKWFDSYEKMILKYAKLSNELNIEMLSVSCELIRTNNREEKWRNIISNIRNVYKGLLTVSANHDGEEMNKKWWDALDYIGVNAYYMPIQSRSLTFIQNDVDKELEDIALKLENLSKAWNKPIIITEIGFCSGNCKINNREYKPTLTDFYLQAYFYERFMNVLSDKECIKGFFWWNWYSDPNVGGMEDQCLTPQMKQAEFVLYQYYQGQKGEVKFGPINQPKCQCII